MISEIKHDDVTLHNRERTGSFISGQQWATYRRVAINASVPVQNIHAEQVLVFDDPDAGMHAGECDAVRNSYFIGEIKEVWDKDSDGEGEIHVCFRRGPRVPVEYVHKPNDRERAAYDEHGNTWVESHEPDAYSHTDIELNLCATCKDDPEHRHTVYDRPTVL